MNKLKLFVSFGFALFAFIFAPLTLAGGQLIHVTADSYGATNSDGTYGRIIRIVSSIRPCEGTEITLKFVDPKEGDYVMTQSGSATFTFTKDRQPYYEDGEQVCGTIAKMGSRVLGEREITVLEKNGNPPPVIKVAFDGQYHSEDYHDGYSYSPSQDTPAYRLNHSSSSPTSIQAPSADINVWLLNQELIDNLKRKVTIKWGAFDGNPGTFIIYVKVATNKNNWEEKFDGSKGPSAKITLKADQDYHIKVAGCMDKFGTCVDSNILTLPKLQKNEGGKVISPETSTPVSSTTVDQDNKEGELNQKIANLEAKLSQSEHKQSILEQRINDLINFIKNLFPFFK